MKFNMEDRRKVKEEAEANLTEVHALSILQDKFGNIKNVVCDFPNLHELIYVHLGCLFLLQPVLWECGKFFMLF
jgi:hypothetical protein